MNGKLSQMIKAEFSDNTVLIKTQLHNRCGYMLIVVHLKEAFAKRYPTIKLDYELIDSICGGDYKKNPRMTLNQFVRFFEHFHIQLIVYDRLYNILYENINPEYVKHMPAVYIMATNNHFYFINCNKDSLAVKLKTLKFDNKKKLTTNYITNEEDYINTEKIVVFQLEKFDQQLIDGIESNTTFIYKDCFTSYRKKITTYTKGKDDFDKDLFELSTILTEKKIANKFVLDSIIVYHPKYKVVISRQTDKNRFYYIYKTPRQVLESIRALQQENDDMEKRFYFHSNEPLDAILRDFMNANIQPRLTYRNKAIKTIQFIVGNNIVEIGNDNNEYTGTMNITDEDHYIEYSKGLRKTKNAYIRPLYKSYYAESTQLLMDNNTLGGYINIKENAKNCIEIDFNRYYLSILNDLKKLPQLTKFDRFADYKGEPLEKNTFYYCKNKNKGDNPYLASNYRICWGKNLMAYTGDDLEIIAYIEADELCCEQLLRTY